MKNPQTGPITTPEPSQVSPQLPPQAAPAPAEKLGGDDDERTVSLDRIRLVAERKKRGWSQVMAAEMIGIGKNTLGRAETDVRIRLGIANAIADTYEVRV